VPHAQRHTPRKRFGQHFLHDQTVIARIIAAFGPRPDDAVVEIGPGKGALTVPLLKQLKKLQIIELDRDLGADLASRLPSDRCHVIIQNALKFDFSQLAVNPHSLRIIGNLPYNISTAMIFHLLDQQASIRDMHFMLQKEVVERMNAAPGSRDYGRLSVMLQLHCRCEYLFQVGPGAFTPAPRVDSAVVRLIPHKQKLLEGQALKVLEQIVKRMFSRRRKTIRNGLRGILEEADINHCGVDPGQRPEQLDPAQFIRLAQCVAKSGQSLREEN